MLAREPSTHEPSQGPFSGSGKESQSVKIPANNIIKTNIVIETSSLASVPPLYDLDLFSDEEMSLSGEKDKTVWRASKVFLQDASR